MKIAELSKKGALHLRIVSFLNAAPDDEVYTKADLEDKLQASMTNGGIKLHRFELKDYQEVLAFSGRVQTVWGNKKAIAALRKLNLSGRPS